MKSRCFTQVHEHELVELAVMVLDCSIRKNLDTWHSRYMTQLAYRVQQVERLKTEKSRPGKYHKKQKVAYVEIDEI